MSSETARPAPPAAAIRPGEADTGTVVKALLSLRPYIGRRAVLFALGAVAALGANLVALAIPQVLRGVVNDALAADGGAQALVWASLGVLGLGVLEAALIVSRRHLVIYPGTRVENDMRTAIFRHLVDLPLTFHTGWGSGQLLSRAMTDLNLLRRWLNFGLVMLVVSSVTLVVGVGLMIATNWILGLVYLAAAAPVIIMGFRFRRSYRVVSRLSQDQIGDLATTVEESVLGIRVLKAFGRGRHALERFADQADSLRGTELRKARSLATISLVLSLIPEFALGVILFTGLVLISDGSLTVGALVAFFATAAVVAGPLDRIGNLLALAFDARTAIARFHEVMGTPNELADPAQPKRPTSPARGEVVFDRVSFSYPAGRGEVLHEVSLRVEPGETIAVVGATGSGKSTLIQFVPRLLDPDAGRVLLDGVDVRELSRHELRGLVAVAFEDPVLFSDTVRENVLLGAAERSDAALDEALRTAQAQFAYDLPDGVDTIIGEEGLSLSGGQRQRLALARAIAAKPAVMVLDDPLSALDVTTEELVQRELRRVLAGTTTIVVAHRPSTVALADRVALIDDGRVVVGTHRELLAASRRYREVISDNPEGAAA